MDRHNSLDAPEEFILLERVMQINRYKTCLPVMTVDHIRTEVDDRKHREDCFGEECKFLQIPRCAVVWFRSTEVVFIVNEVDLDSIILHMHDSYITVLISQIHIKMGDIFHFVFPFLLHAGVFRQNNSHIKVTLVKAFRKCSCYIGKSSCLYKRHCL